MMKNGVIYFGISSVILEIFEFGTVHMTEINHKIENISETIGMVSFKLGSGNLRQVKHKKIFTVLLPWQPFFFFCCWVYLTQD